MANLGIKIKVDYSSIDDLAKKINQLTKDKLEIGLTLNTNKATEKLTTFKSKYDELKTYMKDGLDLNIEAHNTNLKMAAERLNAALDLRDKSCRDLRQTTAIAYHDTVKLTEQIQYLREHQRTSEMVRDAYQRQFDIGQRTLLDLLDSENELFDANRALENAQQDLLLAEMRVLASSGKLLETLQLKPVETLKVEDDLDPETLKACATQYVLPARLDKTAIPARTYVPISQIDMQNIQGMNMQPQPGMPAPQQPMPARTMPATK